jgi:transketolase
MLHLTGYPKLTMDQLKKFRQVDSLTPGHPETGLTPGVEVTTGPLGQGLANAVGLAIAQTMLAATHGEDLFNNYTFVVCGDGCLQEGVTAEACALAGHLGLGRLIVLYDDNLITIDGATELSFTEDVDMRFRAQNWEVLSVADGDHDLKGIAARIAEAKQNKSQPTLIRVRTTIGFGSAKAGSEKTHGSPLGLEEVKRVKEKFGMNPDELFHVPEEVSRYYHSRANNGKATEERWNSKFAAYSASHPDKAEELTRRFKGELPKNARELIKKYTSADKERATRQSSGEILAGLAAQLPEMIGGSADLTESTVTNKGELPAYTKSARGNKFIHFGVREHAMCAISNGLSAFGAFLPFASTFANFIGYCWGSMRLSALSHHRVLYVCTHDSIDLGEDGPTHQPIEVLSLLRSTPNIHTIRPADATECAGAYAAFLFNNKGPTVLFLSRSAVPQLQGSCEDGVMKGAYILSEFGDKVSKSKIILSGSGTEVTLLEQAKKSLQETGVSVRIVSYPSWSLFETQSNEYKASVFPKGIPVLHVEAAHVLGWERFATKTVSMTSFGMSGPAKSVKAHFGFTVDNIVKQAMTIVPK